MIFSHDFCVSAETEKLKGYFEHNGRVLILEARQR